MELRDIERLAELARLDITDEEKETLTRDLDSILGYIDQIQSVSVFADDTHVLGALHNVIRDDRTTHTTGEYTERILEQAPDSKDGFVKVKKVFS